MSISDPSPSPNFISFITNQKLNITIVSGSLYKLPETEVRGTPTTIFLRLNDKPELIIKLLEPKFQKLPEHLTQNFQEFSYIETGVFKTDLELKGSIPEILNEISNKVHNLFSKIKFNKKKNSDLNNLFTNHQLSVIKSIKNTQTNRLINRINKRKYLEMHQITETYWLGDLIFITEPDEFNENLNITCMLENDETKEMMILKIIKISNTNESFDQVYYQFDITIHKNFLIDKRIFDFFCEPIKNWLDFSLSTKDFKGNLKVTYKMENTNSGDYEIIKENLNRPKVFLTTISGQSQYFSNHSVSRNED